MPYSLRNIPSGRRLRHASGRNFRQGPPRWSYQSRRQNRDNADHEL